jgi:hydrogenase expression/formation protein HypC
MCLALPALVVSRGDGDAAVVELGGVRQTVSLALVPEATVGDYVIVHVGHAIGLLDADEAEQTLAMWAEMQAQHAADAAAAADAADATVHRAAGP